MTCTLAPGTNGGWVSTEKLAKCLTEREYIEETLVQHNALKFTH